MPQALYRKYRPPTFADVLGQEIITHILKEAVKQNRVSHAYLFAGPRGTGKTTTARILAKAVNCENPQNGEPCNMCAACATINSGTTLDVTEIDAASNRGIDEIRNLKENIRVPPTVLKKKVYIIDEAHMLTKEASNALLKTLEEPPGHVMIILATTESEKIPPTVHSRVQELRFKKVPLQTVVEKLEMIAKKETIAVSREALDLIASAAEGSFRDAESFLDQLRAFSGKDISVEDVEKTIGKAGFHILSNCAHQILLGNLPETLETFADIMDKGYDIIQFTKDLLLYFRRAALLSAYPAINERLKNEFIPEHLAMLETSSKAFETKHLSLIQSLIAAYANMRYSHFPIIPLEVTLIAFLKKE